MMAKAARRYDLFLPLTFNDGRTIPDEHFDTLQWRLVARFGGVTIQQREFPFRGIWQNEARLFFDYMVVMTVLDFRRGGSAH